MRRVRRAADGTSSARRRSCSAARLSLLTLLVVVAVVFAITALLPGDAAQQLLGQAATPEAVRGLRAALGLDQPAWLRYLHWLGGLLTRRSPASRSSTSLPVDAARSAAGLPNSLMLAATTAAVSRAARADCSASPSAMWRGSLLDRIVSVLTVVVGLGARVPGRDAGRADLRGAAALAAGAVVRRRHRRRSASSLRIFAHAGDDALLRDRRADGAHDARRRDRPAATRPMSRWRVLKGAAPARIVLRHALPNAIGPIANAVALSLSYLLGGVIIVETIFNYPGIAKLMVDAVTHARHAAGAGLRDDLLRRLSGARHHRRHLRHRLQPEAAASMSATSTLPPSARAARSQLAAACRRWACSARASSCCSGSLIGAHRPVRIAPHDVGEIVGRRTCSADISAQYPLGTDYLGRDMLSRILLGARYTVGDRAGCASLLASGIGTCCWACCAAVCGRLARRSAQPLARRADLHPQQDVRASSWSPRSAPRSRC